LRPFLARYHELAVLSQKRKIGALREAVTGALERRLEGGARATSGSQSPAFAAEATEALRNGDRILERAQGESFFLTKRIPKMQRAIVDVTAERIAAALIDAHPVDAASVFSETLTQIITEPVAATLRSIEETREALANAMDVVVLSSGSDVPEELPKPRECP
jgi:hypothetical protein